MQRRWSLLVALAAVSMLATFTGVASADPSQDPGDDHGHSHSGPPELPKFTGPTSENMTLVGNADKENTVNSDLAFWGNYAFAGNYNGFRILDIRNPSSPRVVEDYFCRGPQNDVSVYKAGKRLLLFQSIDSAQSQESCDGTQAGSSVDNPILPSGSRSFGFEGIRVFDVTNPAEPVFLDGIPTACGSHTHTLVADKARDQLHLYIPSYPLGTGITDPSQREAAGDLACVSPHKKISVITVPFANPMNASVRQQPLADDTAPAPEFGFQACHDIQVFEPKDIAVASCAGDGQIWDVSDPANPDTLGGTHIDSPSTEDQFEFIHSGIVTWDGEYFAIMDETGGGGTAECDGPPEPEGQSESGFYYFYKMVEPGAPAPALESRFMIPRPQGTEICVSHNANVVPVEGRYLMSAAYYMGGNTMVDFTDVSAPTEVAYSDLVDGTGAADSWSTYWYNGHVYANGGLGRQGATANRGVDVFTVQNEDGSTLRSRSFHHMNPQTQEASQVP